MQTGRWWMNQRWDHFQVTLWMVRIIQILWKSCSPADLSRIMGWCGAAILLHMQFWTGFYLGASDKSSPFVRCMPHFIIYLLAHTCAMLHIRTSLQISIKHNKVWSWSLKSVKTFVDHCSSTYVFQIKPAALTICNLIPGKHLVSRRRFLNKILAVSH